MLHPQEESVLVETSPLAPMVIEEAPDHKALSEPLFTANPHLKIPKRDIRKSLKALTTEGAFATVFYSIIGGALLSNFLLDLGASTVEIGLLASIPQLTNLLQPLGAYVGDRIKSRHWHSLVIFGSSRRPWLLGLAGRLVGSASEVQARVGR